MPATFTVASLTPSSPRTSSKTSRVRGIPEVFSGERSSAAARSTASATPPLFPKIMPAPVDTPRGRSKGAMGSLSKSTPVSRIIRANSCVVRTASTSGLPSTANSGREASNFLAVHGMIDTTYSDSGSTPSSRERNRRATAPNIC
ncbi:MAG: hypothetical protein BWY92_01844 [Firmicutes bacterium ADurb.BinA052]|nr:MAG: hypothetical protein BWY92_01844 [Firmicutes bacterium ADurb.BinA052]